MKTKVKGILLSNTGKSCGPDIDRALAKFVNQLGASYLGKVRLSNEVHIQVIMISWNWDATKSDLGIVFYPLKQPMMKRAMMVQVYVPTKYYERVLRGDWENVGLEIFCFTMNQIVLKGPITFFGTEMNEDALREITEQHP
jgi:hypothetical protein